MSPIAETMIVFLCVFASGLLGLYLRSVLPQQHVQEESFAMVRLCTGVIATLTALVLGLLVASAKGTYDRVNDQVTTTAAAIVLLDRTLAQYGPQTNEARSSLRAAVAASVSTLFSAHGHGVADVDTREALTRGENLQSELRRLAPENDAQRLLQARALELSNQVAQTRMLAITQAHSSLPPVFLVVLVLWLSIMFAGFGLVTKNNPIVIITLFLCAFSVAGAVLMIEELNRPLEGLMKVSSEPMRYALAHLGQ
jgi:Protein of unknown function (DUF4239)